MKQFVLKSLQLGFILLFSGITRCFGFSVLTHEALIDANWDQVLAPLIQEKFEGINHEQLEKARAFAYGGAVVPDMGYYPFGSKLFTNLVHYVRTGDFVQNLFEEAHDVNEFAFALGVLSHYYADIYGHSISVNKSVPLIYPRMEKKFGDIVTFADNRITHLRTEFSFDVLQTSRGNYASESYHDFIGFDISKEVLEKAFRKTYGLEITRLFSNFDKSIETFRWSVKNLIPFATRVAWKTKRKQIMKLNSAARRHSYIYRIPRMKYYREFGRARQKIGFWASLVSFLTRIVPKMGPLRILKFKVPTRRAEQTFRQSFDSTDLYYANAVQSIGVNDLHLLNIDWDTGKKTIQGEYSLADKTYSDWLLRLKEKKFETLTVPIKARILEFYKYDVGGTLPETALPQQTKAALLELEKEK